MNIDAISELFAGLSVEKYRTLSQTHPWIPEDRSELQQTLERNPQLALSAQEDLRFMEVVDEPSNQTKRENIHVKDVLVPQPAFRMHKKKILVKRLETPKKGHKRSSQPDSSAVPKKRKKE